MLYGLKRLYGSLLMGLSGIAGKDAAKSFDAFFRFGRKLNLKEPETLAEKVVYIENHCPSPLASMCTDKWEVREYVKSKGLESLLVPVYGEAYRSFSEIPFDLFPIQFALKATHGCKMNIICTDKATLNMKKCESTVNSWLSTTYGQYSGEWHYFQIPHRVYCEKYLGSPDGIVDYKFHCMNGKPVFVQVISERNADDIHMKDKQNLYDMDWQPINGLTSDVGNVTKCPEHFEEMKVVAETLSSDFKYVRVDLYEIEGKVYFGELTFTPANGVFPHFTNEFIAEMGKKLEL